MNIKYKIVLGSLLALGMLGSPVYAGTSVSIGVGEPPLVYPESDFRYEQGYYRTNNGHYYHYDKDQRAWNYGRNHQEYVHEEQRRAKKHHQEHRE